MALASPQQDAQSASVPKARRQGRASILARIFAIAGGRLRAEPAKIATHNLNTPSPVRQAHT
jgi:hypothetical protein